MIPGYLSSAYPHRQFHTLPGLLDSRAALPNSYPNACMPMQGGSLYHFYDGLWYDPAERRTHLREVGSLFLVPYSLLIRIYLFVTSSLFATYSKLPFSIISIVSYVNCLLPIKFYLLVSSYLIIFTNLFLHIRLN